MSYDGSGTFNINSSGQPVVTATVISSTVFNAFTSDIGTGLSTAICKDGQTATTARIPFASGIGVANGTVAAPAINFSNDTGCGFYRIGSADIGFAISGVKVWDAIAGSLTFSQDLLFTDATYDIGKTGATRPRDFFMSRNATIGGTCAVITSVTAPTIIGGSAVGQALTFQTTTGVGTTDSFVFKGGNNGATTFGTLTSGGFTLPSSKIIVADFLKSNSGATLAIGTISDDATNIISNGAANAHWSFSASNYTYSLVPIDDVSYDLGRINSRVRALHSPALHSGASSMTFGTANPDVTRMSLSAAAATLTIGLGSSSTGKIGMVGTTSGTVTVTPADAAGTWTLTLPTTGGTSGYVLSTNGSGVCSWIAGGNLSGLTSGRVTVGAGATSVQDYSNLTYDGTNLVLGGDIYTDAFQDYTASSTLVGWSAFNAVKLIHYKKLGKLVFVKFQIDGTSNSTSTSFTLPYASEASASGYFFGIRGLDNGTYLTTDGPFGTIAASGSSTATFFPVDSGGTWTASGNKIIYGEFWYQAA